MTITPRIQIINGNLVVQGRTILTGVPENVVLNSGTSINGAYIAAAASHSKSHHVFPLGTFQGLRFVCCFRFKLWWMTQRMGSCGKEVPLETQFMLVESDGEGENGTVYTVFLPLLEGSFRASLQGNELNQLEVCIESGDDAVKTDQGEYMVYMHAGTNPFEVIERAVKAVEKHMQTFHHRDRKKLPSFLDWFGWCTWDAFYTDVTAEGVHDGLKSLSEGGTPPRFLIIDDGWQQIGDGRKDEISNVVVQEGAQFSHMLVGIKENHKFQKNEKEDDDHRRQLQQPQPQPSGLEIVVKEAKQNHGVKHVYIWHAMAGYWGGVKPSAEGMEHYESTLSYPTQSPGVLANQPDIVMDSLTVNGIGLVNPTKALSFFDEMHTYLSSCGVDGVKVDVQNIIETLGAGHGGRVSITRTYHRALEASVRRNFPDNGCISCMCHNTDGLYSARQTAVVRASDDFYPRDPASHTIHISSVAYNTLFLGEFMQPDWDMFHSLHPAAEYHGAARAIGGCAIYVSDKPGHHNFDLLRKLVLPDGSVLRARLPGRPTRDSLFADPARDGTSLLKIWNVNRFSGVVGVFNCQGAGWCKTAKKTQIHDGSPGALTGSVKARDVDGIGNLAGEGWDGDAILYAFRSGEMKRVAANSKVMVTLKVLEYELFHVCPIRDVGNGVSFAPIGLLDMFNSGGAVERFEVESSSDVVVGLRGCGLFGAYSSRRPSKCRLDSVAVEFDYDDDNGLLTLDVPVPEKEMYRWKLEIEVQ